MYTFGITASFPNQCFMQSLNMGIQTEIFDRILQSALVPLTPIDSTRKMTFKS